MKKRGRQTGKERFTIDASLCGRGDLLKALGSVASYLADRLFNLSNDNLFQTFQQPSEYLHISVDGRALFSRRMATGQCRVRDKESV